jgi:hypothetical protein
MPRGFRALLLGSIAIAYVYLSAHAREPLRLDVGDPASDAAALLAVHAPSADVVNEIDNPPLSRLVFGAAARVTGGDIGALRPLALVFSALATGLLFIYVSRLYDRRVALVAAMLFTTSLLWLTHADSIHQAPLMQCMAFLALWGTVRAIETHEPRHYLAVGLGSCACLLAAYDYYLVLPVAVIATIHVKTGQPFSRSNRRLLLACAAGCVVAIVTTCLLGHAPRLAPRYDHELVTTLPAIARRATLGLTPFLWITVAVHVIALIRARTLADAIKDSVAWLLVAAALWWLMFSRRPAALLIGLQVFLPFYAIGSALLVTRLLDGSQRQRRLAMAWLVAAPLWSFYWTFSQPRAWLDRDDAAEASTYLAGNDSNDFVMSNLLDDAPLQAALGRRVWDALEVRDATEAPPRMLQLFELTGADSVHAIIFTDPLSRFTDLPLSTIALPRRLWSVLGWPQIARRKSTALIREYDERVLANLTAVRATKVLQLRHFAIYRIDRAATRAVLEERVPATPRIDFDSVDASLHELLGWDPLRAAYASPGTTLHGFQRCRDKHCKTVATDHGLVVPAAEWSQTGQLMIRVDHACDLVLTATFAEPSEVRFVANGFATAARGSPVTVTIPASALSVGVNVVELESLSPGLRVSSIDLASRCEHP